jgi:hypothetical protein
MELRREILAIRGEFRMKELTERHPGIPKARVRRVVRKLRDEGKLTSRGQASGVRYSVVDARFADRDH